MMDTEEISETLVFKSILTGMIPRDNFSTIIRREGFKSYMLHYKQNLEGLNV
jgi:hypothetical protein